MFLDLGLCRFSQVFLRLFLRTSDFFYKKKAICYKSKNPYKNLCS
jgi:hypothetical protein